MPHFRPPHEGEARHTLLAGGERCSGCEQRYLLQMERRCGGCDRGFCGFCVTIVRTSGSAFCNDCHSHQGESEA